MSKRAGQDEGQALVMVTIAIMLLALIVPVVVSQLSGESGLSSNNANFEAALAAAEAGAQQYKNYLDLNSNYYTYSGTGCPGVNCNDDGDTALDPNGWTAIAGSSPAEAFHYIPNTAYLGKGAGAVPQVLLTVTGRAGVQGHYSYRTIQAVMQSSGLLSNAYYSSYEVLDPAQNPTPVTYTAAGGGSPTTYSIDPNAPPGDAVPGINGESLWSALCQYDTYTPNTFVDSQLNPPLRDPYAGYVDYSATHPYYGPFRGPDPLYGNSTPYTLTVDYPGGATATVTEPCGTIYSFVDNEIFNGPVYTGDQLWVCGRPQFEKGLTSAVPVGFKYLGGWPTQNGKTSGTNGWIDNGLVDWDSSCGGAGQSNPTFTKNPPSNPTGLQQGGTESLPSTNTLLPQIALDTGCVYTGPTMIEFVAGGTFNVWSPMSGNNTGGAGPGTCGSGFSPSNPYVTNLPVPATGLVVFDQNVPSGQPVPAASSITNGLPTGATCPNPWKPWAPASACSSDGSEGDLVVEGELQGQVTLDAAANIIVSRDLSYQCAVSKDGSVGAQDSPTYPGLPLPSCFPNEPDVLGLVAGGDVVISHPAPAPAGFANASVTKGSKTVTVPSGGFPGVRQRGSCGGSGPGMSVIGNGIPAGTTVDTVSGNTLTLSQRATATATETVVINDDPSATDSCGNLLNQTEPYEWSPGPGGGWCSNDGTETSGITVANVEPNCDMVQPTIDAAVIGLNGSLADEEWGLGQNDGTCSDGGCHVWVQGADIGEYRGPFGNIGGCGGICGYKKAFSYDSRLYYLSPPSLNRIADALWTGSSFVSCGSIDDEQYTQPAGPSGKVNICPGAAF